MKKETIFYFSGRAGDLWTALLAKATDDLEKQNQINAKKLIGPLKTISALTTFVKSTDRASVKDFGGNPIRVSVNGAALRSLIRPPMVLTGRAFRKLEVKHEN